MTDPKPRCINCQAELPPPYAQTNEDRSHPAECRRCVEAEEAKE